MPARFVLWVTVLCCLPAGLRPATATQHDRAGAASEQREPRKYIAVMGEVAVPGVHAVMTETPMLSDFVKQAGGLTSRANGAVRVVRNGRTILNSHASTDLQIRLLPGDVVIAAGKNSSEPIIVPNSVPRPVQERAPVEIALVNLIERPVLLKLRPRHASLAALLQLLGQHPNVGRFVRIVASGQSGRLQNGSVLVFDRRVVDARRIPPLPNPIVPKIIQSATTVRPVSASEQRPIRQVQGNEKDGPETDGRDLTTVPPPEFPASAPPTIPVSPKPLRTAANTVENRKRFSDPQAAVPPTESQTPANGDLVKKADRDERETKAPGASIDLMTLIITVFAVVGVLSAAGLLISMGRRALRGHRRADTPARRRSRLDQLLHKELEIVVENVAIPAGQTFFGRAAGPRNRIDDLHPTDEMHRPHIDAEMKPGLGDAGPPPGARRSTVSRADGPESVRPMSPGTSAGTPRSSSRVYEEELG
jgi:hypothetical protein